MKVWIRAKKGLPLSSPLLIKLIKEKPGITVLKLAEKLEITERAVKKQIAALKEDSANKEA